MSKSMKIAVLEPSDIVREGIRSVLLKINENFRLFRVKNTQNLIPFLQKEQPDILIVNPCVPGLERPCVMRQETGLSGLFVVGLLTSIDSFRWQGEYDVTVSILDDFESVREKIGKLIPRKEEPEEERSLSQREKEIVVYIAKGYTNKQIADALCISSHTVITHRRNIAAKLQIHSPAGLTIYAVVNKLVKLEEIKN